MMWVSPAAGTPILPSVHPPDHGLLQLLAPRPLIPLETQPTLQLASIDMFGFVWQSFLVAEEGATGVSPVRSC